MLNRRFSRTERESATADEERLRPCTCLLLTGDRLPGLDRGDTNRSSGGEIAYVSPEFSWKTGWYESLLRALRA